MVRKLSGLRSKWIRSYFHTCVCVCVLGSLPAGVDGWGGGRRRWTSPWGIALPSAVSVSELRSNSEGLWASTLYVTELWLVSNHNTNRVFVHFLSCSCPFRRLELSVSTVVTLMASCRCTLLPCTAMWCWPPSWSAMEPTSTHAPTRAPHRFTWPVRTVTSRWD